MQHNLVVSFVLGDWMRQAPLIVAAIEELGPSARISGWTWYVRSSLDASDAALRIRDVLDEADELFISDLTENCVTCLNVDERTIDFMARHWCRDSTARDMREVAA